MTNANFRWPRRVVLSRKGFDGSTGGVASPIYATRKMVSIPIPDRNSHVRYGDLRYEGRPMPDVLKDVEAWQCPSCEVHLDPDLRKDAIERTGPWWPIFGQSGNAQQHLDKQEIGIGAGTPADPFDLFLFYGYFKAVGERARSILTFREGHVIFGWLQVGKRVRVLDPAATAEEFPECAPHPHILLSDRSVSEAHRRNNTLFFARPELTFDSRVAGAGIFPTFRKELCLSADPLKKDCRSRWIPLLERKTGVPRTGHRQEHVIQLRGPRSSELTRWLNNLFAGAAKHSPRLERFQGVSA